jgi:hypothetical protein
MSIGTTKKRGYLNQISPFYKKSENLKIFFKNVLTNENEAL